MDPVFGPMGTILTNASIRILFWTYGYHTYKCINLDHVFDLWVPYLQMHQSGSCFGPMGTILTNASIWIMLQMHQSGSCFGPMGTILTNASIWIMFWNCAVSLPWYTMFQAVPKNWSCRGERGGQGSGGRKAGGLEGQEGRGGGGQGGGRQGDGGGGGWGQGD